MLPIWDFAVECAGYFQPSVIKMAFFSIQWAKIIIHHNGLYCTVLYIVNGIHNEYPIKMKFYNELKKSSYLKIFFLKINCMNRLKYKYLLNLQGLGWLLVLWNQCRNGIIEWTLKVHWFLFRISDQPFISLKYLLSYLPNWIS